MYLVPPSMTVRPDLIAEGITTRQGGGGLVGGCLVRPDLIAEGITTSCGLAVAPLGPLVRPDLIAEGITTRSRIRIPRAESVSDPT